MGSLYSKDEKHTNKTEILFCGPHCFADMKTQKNLRVLSALTAKKLRLKTGSVQESR
jgi:hypothetical protein